MKFPTKPHNIFHHTLSMFPHYLKKIISKSLVASFFGTQCIGLYKQEDMLREHKPPPIRRIRISDFGLPDLKRDPDCHQNCNTWSLSHALPLQKNSSKSVHEFASNPTDRQTDKQTDKQTELKT